MNLIAPVVLLAFLAAPVAVATCDYPRAPENFPNGATASKEEMVTAKQEVSRYNDDITAYLECLKAETDEQLENMKKEGAELQTDADKKALAERTEELEKRRTQKHNAAVDEVTAVVERFNEQLRAYKKKQGG